MNAFLTSLKNSVLPIALQLLLGYTWIHSAWGKFSQPGFRQNLGKTLAGFAKENPNGWYVSSFLAFAQNNVTLFGQLVRWGELLTGFGLMLGAYGVWRSTHATTPLWLALIIIGALLGGLFLSVNFYFAAGWMSPSTKTLNSVLFWSHLILILSWILLVLRHK